MISLTELIKRTKRYEGNGTFDDEQAFRYALKLYECLQTIPSYSTSAQDATPYLDREQAEAKCAEIGWGSVGQYGNVYVVYLGSKLWYRENQ